MALNLSVSLKSVTFFLFRLLQTDVLFSLGDTGNAVASESESLVGDHLSLDAKGGSVDYHARAVNNVNDDGQLAGKGTEIDVDDSAKCEEYFLIHLRTL